VCSNHQKTNPQLKNENLVPRNFVSSIFLEAIEPYRTNNQKEHREGNKKSTKQGIKGKGDKVIKNYKR
jgi:hypothetical protein